MTSSKAVLTIVAAAILALTASAQATLLFYEGFDYSGGTTVAGIGTPLGATGTWAQSSGTNMIIAPPHDPHAEGDDFTGLPAGVPGAGSSYAAGRNQNENRLKIGLAASVTDTFVDGTTTVDELCGHQHPKPRPPQAEHGHRRWRTVERPRRQC